MTQPLHTLSACEAAERLAQRSLRAEDLVRACLEHIDAREPEVQAWQHLARDAAIARAKQLDAGAHQGVLHGLPIGVKDLLATADMPTGYGSAIYQHHTPAADAACVAVARQQGAVVMGAFALGSALVLTLGPWLWLRLRGFQNAGDGSGAWGVRLAGLALAASSGWALWMGLVEYQAPWCIVP